MASKGGRVPESHEPGQYTFHYNREEREAMLSDETKKLLEKTKLFSINRRNMIILIDIIVIMLFAMIFLPITMGMKSSVKLDGFRSTLRAYEYDGSVLVSIRVHTLENNPDEAGIISVNFSAEGIEEAVNSVDLLPSDTEKDRILRAEFNADDVTGQKIEAEIELNGKKRKLSTKIRDE